MGKINNKQLPKSYQFALFDDEKLRLALVGLADKYDEKIREFIYRTYNDMHIMNVYINIRRSEEFEKGNNKVVTRRKIVEFPNRHVYDFCKTVMTALYGEDWLNNNQALRHELIRPWWVVNKLDVEKGRSNWKN